jgi:hypothetical protein
MWGILPALLLVFGGEVENQTSTEEKPVNKNRTIIISVVAVVALACFCLLAGLAAFYAFTTIRSVQTSPAQPGKPSTPQSGGIGIGEPPSGGLANDILRNDTWQVMAPIAVGFGCDLPIGANSTIEVLQQPDAAGHWVEKWTVMCNSGDTHAFEVEFILDNIGATFNIKPLP